MNNIATKLQKMLDTQNCLQDYIKNAEETEFLLQLALYSSKEALAKFYLSTTFGLSFKECSLCSPYPTVWLLTHI